MCNIIKSCLETGDIERRLEALEQHIASRSPEDVTLNPPRAKTMEEWFRFIAARRVGPFQGMSDTEADREIARQLADQL